MGTYKVADDKCNPDKECYCFAYNQGKVLLNSITVKTKTGGCPEGCDKEGVVVHLQGERNSHYPGDLPCSTHLLDHTTTKDFDGSSGGRASFDGKLNGRSDDGEEGMMGECYEVISSSNPLSVYPPMCILRS